jgi:Holliday junction resolvasome RuvABC DNA-binding subunit
MTEEMPMEQVQPEPQMQEDDLAFITALQDMGYSDEKIQQALAMDQMGYSNEDIIEILEATNG